MTKLILTILLTLSFSAISSSSGDFSLKKADLSRSNISIFIAPNIAKTYGYDDCGNIFQQCIDSGEDEFICEIIEEECYEGY